MSRTRRLVAIAPLIRGIVAILVVPLLVTAIVACSPSATGAPGQTPSSSSVPSVPAGAIGVNGRVHAGPTCPVSRPDDSSCADRPLAGAVLVVTTAAGTEVARATSAADGTFTVVLPPGDYVLVPQPVTGLMGTAQRQPFRAQGDGAAPAPLDVAYDTGIR